MNIGSAPVSFGIHGGVDLSRFTLSPQALLDAIATAGYGGSELGPPGFFGTPSETVAAFRDAGLQILGAYVPLHLTAPAATVRADLDSMQRTLDELAAAAGSPLAILADEGDASLIARPFRTASERGWKPDDWKVAMERLAEAQDLAAAAGVRTSFHPHFGTYVEQASEIETLMELSDIGLCLDTGHFRVGGADPVAFLQRYGDRVNHVHVKDVRLSVIEQAMASADPSIDSWWDGLSAPLGTADVDLPAFMAALVTSDYDGWVVVEQDGAPATSGTWDRIVADQVHNFRWVQAHAGQ